MADRGKKRALPRGGREEMAQNFQVAGGKKVRFGAAAQGTESDDDDVEPADDLEGPSSRRNAVIAPEDGGSSDEDSDDGDGPANKASVDDDEDMFNSATANKKPSKDDTDRIKDAGLRLREGADGQKSEYISLGDLDDQEFQVLDKEDSDDQEEFEEEDIHANDDDAPRSRRSKKGMGYQLSGFNMKEELSEGRMTADGCWCLLIYCPCIVPQLISHFLLSQRTLPTKLIHSPDTMPGWMVSQIAKLSNRPKQQKMLKQLRRRSKMPSSVNYLALDA